MPELLSIAAITAVGFLWVGFLIGAVPIPIGYDRGKIKFLMWCGTGMHAHTVYRHPPEIGHTDRASFQTIHPADLSDS